MDPYDGRTLSQRTNGFDDAPSGHSGWSVLLEAIRAVESNNNPDAVGDNGNAIGTLSNLGGLPYRCLRGWKS